MSGEPWPRNLSHTALRNSMASARGEIQAHRTAIHGLQAHLDMLDAERLRRERENPVCGTECFAPDGTSEGFCANLTPCELHGTAVSDV